MQEVINVMDTTGMSSGELDLHDVKLCQQLMVWAMVAWLAGFFPPAMVVTIPFQLYGVYRMTRALRIGAVRRAVLMLIVLLPVICLLLFIGLHQQASRVLRAGGRRTDRRGDEL